MIYNRHFDYTLVMDSDTRLPAEGLLELLDVAVDKPRCGIIQPAIRLYARGDDPIFQHIECLRQEIMEPQSIAFLALLGQCSFFGKGARAGCMPCFAPGSLRHSDVLAF